MRGISHVAIGVRDIERSLSFYRDALGLTVSLDKEESVRGSQRLFAGPAQNRRRVVYLKWGTAQRRDFSAVAKAGRAVRPADQDRPARDSSFRFLGERSPRACRAAQNRMVSRRARRSRCLRSRTLMGLAESSFSV